MTAKERIYEIMDSLPDGVTFEDALYELYVASKIERGLEQAERGEGIPHEEAKQMIDEWLQLSAKEEILTLLAGLPDAPTYADAFDRLRPLYYRHVAPIIAQYGNPPRPSGQWRRDITGAGGIGSAEAGQGRQGRIAPADAGPTGRRFRDGNGGRSDV